MVSLLLYFDVQLVILLSTINVYEVFEIKFISGYIRLNLISLQIDCDINMNRKVRLERRCAKMSRLVEQIVWDDSPYLEYLQSSIEGERTGKIKFKTALKY